MVDLYPPSRQRPALLAFAAALNSSPACLRRDECLDWRIVGGAGHVYAIPGGWQFWCSASSARALSAAKKALSFAVLTQDGDDEGVHFLDRLPTPTEADHLRRYLGIRKRRDISEEQLAELRGRASIMRGSQREKLASAASDGALGHIAPPGEELAAGEAVR